MPYSDARDVYRVNLPWEVVKRGTKLPMNKYGSLDYRKAAEQVIAAFDNKVAADAFARQIPPKYEVRHCPC